MAETAAQLVVSLQCGICVLPTTNRGAADRRQKACAADMWQQILLPLLLLQVAALLSCPQQPGPEGSTKGVGWERTAPASAVRLLHIGPLPHITLPSLNGTSWSQNAAHLKVCYLGPLIQVTSLAEGTGAAANLTLLTQHMAQTRNPLIPLAAAMKRLAA